MKEFIEKLVGRLEETDFNDIQMVVREVLLKYGFPYESIVQDEVWDDLDELSSNKFAIKIVNELAEEYKGKYVRIGTLEQFKWERDVAIEQLKELGYGLGEKVGWIPCTERLPETYEYVLVWCNGRFIEGPCIGEECQWYGIGVLYGKVWTVYQCKDIKDIEVIAWQPLPEPYKKGEN